MLPKLYLLLDCMRSTLTRVLGLTMFLTMLGCSELHAEPWLNLDTLGDQSRGVLRQADKNSLRRDEPWAMFKERWLGYKKGAVEKPPGTVDEEAINCLTGAWGGIAFEAEDPVLEKRMLTTITLAEIESGQKNSVKINVERPNLGAQTNMLKFACGCPDQHPQHMMQPVPEARLKEIYERHIRKQLAVTSYRIRFMEFESLTDANSALRRLDSGESFAAVADSLHLRPDFPGGDLGWHPQHDWPHRKARVFRSLRVGTHTKEPVKYFSTYTLYFLEDRREEPTDSFEIWRPEIEAYARRTLACGRSIP
jgi:hypothetical protein